MNVVVSALSDVVKMIKKEMGRAVGVAQSMEISTRETVGPAVGSSWCAAHRNGFRVVKSRSQVESGSVTGLAEKEPLCHGWEHRVDQAVPHVGRKIRDFMLLAHDMVRGVFFFT